MWTASLYKPNDKIILTICKTRSLYSLCNQMPSLVTYSFLIVCTMLNFLLARGFPGHIVKVLVDWYGKTFSRVRWNDVFSSLVSIRSGIRHCGILSPFLFNIIMWTHSSRFSDHLICWQHVLFGCLAYVDDFVLLSGSVACTAPRHA